MFTLSMSVWLIQNLVSVQSTLDALQKDVGSTCIAVPVLTNVATFLSENTDASL